MNFFPFTCSKSYCLFDEDAVLMAHDILRPHLDLLKKMFFLCIFDKHSGLVDIQNFEKNLDLKFYVRTQWALYSHHTHILEH